MPTFVLECGHVSSCQPIRTNMPMIGIRVMISKTLQKENKSPPSIVKIAAQYESCSWTSASRSQTLDLIGGTAIARIDRAGGKVDNESGEHETCNVATFRHKERCCEHGSR